VAGAGIVGTATALWAAMRGLDVILCDPAPPGSGASYGNACTIATYGCLPVNDPGLFTALPRLLFGRDSPLAVNPLHVLTNPRWMLSFLANCAPSRVAAISENLAALLSHADAGLNPLLEEVDAGDLIMQRGQMTVWNTKAGFAGAQGGIARRRALGVRVDDITPQDAAAMEPGLRLPIRGAIHFPDARHVRDPAELIDRFVLRFQSLGGKIIKARITRVRASEQGVEVVLDSGDTLRAGRLALTAGAHATDIKGTGAERLPLDVERGYHVQYTQHADRLTRPVGWAEGGFYATPMARGLRLAGTVEIAGKNPPPNPRRLAYLRRSGRRMFGPLDGPEETWMGLRPSFPDALPVIGPSPKSDRILLAFGHQHLGLTLSGITGRIVADMAQDRQPNMDLDAYAAARF
jgi:D-amino-acid dehydrogenase